MNNNEIKTAYGVVRNVNGSKLNKIKKMRVARIAATLLLLTALSTTLIFGHIERNKINEIPFDQTTVIVSVDIMQGDTMYDIANRFYSSDCEGVYRYVDNYVKAIQKENNNYSDYIERGDTLKIPVIIEKDNPYYLQILSVNNKIKDIEENNLWVRYTVKPGDSFSELAQLSSGSISETYENLKKIYSKNNMSEKTLLRDGNVIWIMNPELGQLKLELISLEEQLEQSLIVNQQKK